MSFNAAFWKWFGNSKVVDAKGAPLVVYHATLGTPINAFHKTKSIIYFSESKEYVECLISKHALITTAYLRIKNPLDLTEYSGGDLISADTLRGDLEEYGVKYDPPSDSDAEFWLWLRSDRINMPKAIRKAGYDGIIMFESDRICGISKRVFCAFEPDQIKSATGNDGTWDADDPDIRSNPPELPPLLPYLTLGMKGIVVQDGKERKFVAWSASSRSDWHHDEIARAAFPGKRVVAKLGHDRTGVYVVAPHARTEDDAIDVARVAAREFDWPNIFPDEDLYIDYGFNEKNGKYLGSISGTVRQMKPLLLIHDNPALEDQAEQILRRCSR